MNPENMSGGTGEPGGDRMPESWIGQEVIVLHDDNATTDGPLLEVNDRGVAIRHFQNFKKLEEARNRGEEGGEPLYVIYFFPWHTVRTIVRPEEEST